MLRKLKEYFGGQPDQAPVMPLHRRPRVRISTPYALIYVVPDVHGCYEELVDAEQRIVEDASAFGDARRLVVMLGDYVDRGPRSADVVEHLCRGDFQGFDRLCLCGNHDDVMLQFMADPERHAEWLDFGGDVTLLSYGLDVADLFRRGRYRAVRDAALEAIPREHLEFLASLPTLAVYGRIVFAHAGLRPGVTLSEQTDEDLMWIREPFLSQGAGAAVTVIHGHTVSVRPDIGPNRLGIDTGAYASGRLSVLRIARGGAALI